MTVLPKVTLPPSVEMIIAVSTRLTGPDKVTEFADEVIDGPGVMFPVEVIEMSPVAIAVLSKVTAELLTMVSDVRGVLLPTIPINRMVPVPAVMPNVWAPLTEVAIVEKRRLPLPVLIVEALLSVMGPKKVMFPVVAKSP